MNNPRFPIYIPSKGRPVSRLTSRSLEGMGVPYYIVVEEQEYGQYAAVIDKSKIIVLDKAYLDKYDTFDRLGDTKSKGPGAARNFIWDHSMAAGHEWHWVMDDNIKSFWRLAQNKKIIVSSGIVFRCMEDFVLRYKNIAMAGPNYTYFCPRKSRIPPFITNTRIYSCNLIRNSLPFRWRGRYNEDTDLSLRMLKAGWVTVQFNAFLQWKSPTQTIGGGNTDDFYSKEGTYPKSKMQVDMHPDISRLMWRFKRWHHYVDYSGFTQKLIRRDGCEPSKEIDNYGMSLITIPDAEASQQWP